MCAYLSIDEVDRVVAFVRHVLLHDVVQVPCVHSRRQTYQVRITEELRALAIVRRLVRRVVPQYQGYIEDAHSGSRPARLINLREGRGCYVSGTHRTYLRFRLILEVILLK